MVLLSTVSEVFVISGRGCVISPGIPAEFSTGVKVKDELHLRRPDGSTFNTYVAGLEFFTPSPGTPHPVPILLPPDIGSRDVPIGTNVFFLDPIAASGRAAH